ncbi:MAG: dihydrofolate reductase family protein [candidate division KSB1 bacterium]|nr:dihydrofolate reductase family protein [candidate division KSB1 bacterium]MDZ7274183.1 dihydrofolate reductase family protein [candidate division KSB1 bacterium]MDZ7287773.1 dihydrofolate reductase family protein [candidate division KSB1 bacterium]MDZ7296781.1 dihydrofolate reductase family protein [candidate division KSB1 bacterium]MDZ7347647.1 dihydrofolate reductase family protein [candidate division KSB1 bacterium]
MRNAVFAINMTVDGYFGHEDGIADEELHEFFTGLLRNADIALFGRKTYQLMFPYWHTVAENQSETKATNEFARTIDAINKIVFSRTLKNVEMKNTTLSRANVEEELLKLKGQPGKDIFIDGLSIAAHLTQLGMIDEYHFVVHPVVAAKGPRLFEADGLKERLRLKLVGSKKFRSGAITLHYKKPSL